MLLHFFWRIPGHPSEMKSEIPGVTETEMNFTLWPRNSFTLVFPQSAHGMRGTPQEAFMEGKFLKPVRIGFI